MAQRSPFFRRETRPEMVDRGGVPVWQNNERFKSDVFTFVRVRYSSGGSGRSGGGWATDYPDAELNFSYRLQELTAIDGLVHDRPFGFEGYTFPRYSTFFCSTKGKGESGLLSSESCPSVL